LGNLLGALRATRRDNHVLPIYFAGGDQSLHQCFGHISGADERHALAAEHRAASLTPDMIEVCLWIAGNSAKANGA